MLDFIECEINAIDIASKLGVFAEKQIPFATAQTLTVLAARGKKKVEKGMDKEFNLRNTFSKRGIQTNRAEKKAWPNCFSEVGVHEKRDYLIDHILGGTRKGNASHGRAVIGADFAGSARGVSGKVKKGKRPSALVARSKKRRKRRGRKAFVAKHRVPSLPFIIKSKRGANDLVVQRMGAGRRDELQLLYAFNQQVKIKESFDFDGYVQRVVKEDAAEVFYELLNRAMGLTV